MSTADEKDERHTATSPSRRLVPVKVRTMRHIYRDIIAASAAGEAIYQVLATIPPIRRIDVCTIAWTGDPKAPLAMRREESYGMLALDIPAAGQLNWYRFAAGSRMTRIVSAEYEAYYPDAQRDYSSLKEFGLPTYKLVIGSRLVSVVFDPHSPFTALKQQINSLLDMITQSLLDFLHRHIRYYQDQIAMLLSQDQSVETVQTIMSDSEIRKLLGDGTTAARSAYELLERNARLFASFFDITQVEFLLAPRISKLVFFREVLPSETFEGNLYHKVGFTVGHFSPSLTSRNRTMHFPMPWGTSAEDGQFVIRFLMPRDMNDHVRKALQLGQVLIKCREQIEALFDRRYREYRIYQDSLHFERCKQVRNKIDQMDSLRQYMRDAVADYEEDSRKIPRSLVFPRFGAWDERLSLVLKNTQDDPLEFRDEIRPVDIREYRYLNMKTPPELRAILLDALTPRVFMVVESEHPALRRLSDTLPEADPDRWETKQIFSSSGATVSVLYDRQLLFRFNRLRGKFIEFLESLGEGVGRLFLDINNRTGIRNRSALVKNLEFLVQQVSYSREVSLEVSSLDISSFKIFNELFGHPFGDRVIRHVAHALDATSPGLAFHVSGDEYYVVHCYHEDTGQAWMDEFFATKNIIPRHQWQDYRTQLQRIVEGVALEVPLMDVDPEAGTDGPLGGYRLVDFLANFFVVDAEGKPGKKPYSRTGDDYYKVIIDPDRRVQSMVDEVWEALETGAVSLGSPEFDALVLSRNRLGASLWILPRLTIGTVAYRSDTVLPYVSDIIDQADLEAGKNKK